MHPLAVRFMTLSGAFETARTETFPSLAAATAAVAAYAAAAGYGNVRVIDSEDDGYRFTARTPEGRSGRNVAFADYDFDGEAR